MSESAERERDPIFDSTIDEGENDAARLDLGDRLHVDVFFKSGGGVASTLTVEVSNDAYDWHPFDSQDLTDDSNVFQYEVPWTYIRAYGDSNLTKIEISAQRS